MPVKALFLHKKAAGVHFAYSSPCITFALVMKDVAARHASSPCWQCSPAPTSSTTPLYIYIVYVIIQV